MHFSMPLLPFLVLYSKPDFEAFRTWAAKSPVIANPSCEQPASFPMINSLAAPMSIWTLKPSFSERTMAWLDGRKILLEEKSHEPHLPQEGEIKVSETTKWRKGATPQWKRREHSAKCPQEG